MGSGTVLFPDIPGQLNETYDFLKKIFGELGRLKHSLGSRELKRLITAYREGIDTINLTCLRIIAESEVSKEVNKKLNITFEERKHIVNEILNVSYKLNEIVKSGCIQEFLAKYPLLAKKVYLKMYGEKEDYLPENIYESEEEFLGWIHRLHNYISKILSELDNALKEP